MPVVRLRCRLSVVAHHTAAISTVVHRFEEVINGHEYLIEVCPVDSNRWRAYLVHLPGGPTALMPFYGATPDEAAHQLSNWLTLAHRTQPNPV